MHQTKLTDILNPNKFKNCELKPLAALNKSFLSIPFLGLPCSLRNKKIIESLCSTRFLQKGHNLNPGNYIHFEVDGAKSKLQYMVSWKWSRQAGQ